MYVSTWWSLEEWVKTKRVELKEPREINKGAYSRKYFEQYAVYCERELRKKEPLLIKNEKERFTIK